MRRGGQQMVEIALREVVIPITRPTEAPVGDSTLAEPLLDLRLQLVGKLQTAAGEELDAVVGHRIVRRRKHHAEVGVQLGGEEGDTGRRDDVDDVHVHTCAGQTRHHGGLQELTADAGIAPDDGDGRGRCSCEKAPTSRAHAPPRPRGRPRAQQSGQHWRHHEHRRCRTADPHSPLGVLRRLTGLLQAVLLRSDPGVTREEAGPP